MKQDKVFKTAKELIEYAENNLTNDDFSTSQVIENSRKLKMYKEALPMTEQEIFMDHVRKETAKNFAKVLGRDVSEIENLLDSEIDDLLADVINDIQADDTVSKKSMTVSCDEDITIMSFNFIPTFGELIHGIENHDKNYFVAIESVGSRDNIIVLEFMGNKKDIVIGFDEETNITKTQVTELTKKLVGEIENRIEQENKKVKQKYINNYLAYKNKKGSPLN